MVRHTDQCDVLPASSKAFVNPFHGFGQLCQAADVAGSVARGYLGDSGSRKNRKSEATMPFADPDRGRAYFREYRRLRRGGDECSTPRSTPLPAEFRLETASDVLSLIEFQVQAVLDDGDASTLEKARCIGYLASVSLKAIECGNLAARLEALECVLKARKTGDGKP